VEKHAEDGVDFMTIHAGINGRPQRDLRKTADLPISYPEGFFDICMDGAYGK